LLGPATNCANLLIAADGRQVCGRVKDNRTSTWAASLEDQQGSEAKFRDGRLSPKYWGQISNHFRAHQERRPFQSRRGLEDPMHVAGMNLEEHQDRTQSQLETPSCTLFQELTHW